MSGGGGGGGGGPQGPAPQQVDAPQAKLQTEGWGGMGHTPVPQTFSPDAFSAQWMNPGFQSYGQQPGMPNWFASPWWGRNAVTGDAMTQQMMQPQQQLPQQQAPAPAPESPGKAPRKRRDLRTEMMWDAFRDDGTAGYT